MQLRFIHKKPRVKRVRPDMRNLNTVEAKNTKKGEPVSVFPKTEDVKPEPIKIVAPVEQVEESVAEEPKPQKKNGNRKPKKQHEEEEEQQPVEE